MHIKKTNYFTLLEVLIAMALTFILLSVLMSSYLQITKINIQAEKDQEESFKKLYLSTRLAAILPQTIPANHKEKDFFFYSGAANDGLTKSGSQTLTFTFDNGIKLDTNFSNHVIGRLYLNTENQFCLAIWPSPSRLSEGEFPPMKHEILFEGVEALNFKFFMPPQKDRQIILKNHKRKFKDNELLKGNSLGEWKAEWLEEYHEAPPLVRIEITLKSPSKDITLVYPLPQSSLIIVYE